MKLQQVAVCLRSTDDNFDAYEDFVGMYAVESVKVGILVQVLKDILLHINLSSDVILEIALLSKDFSKMNCYIL